VILVVHGNATAPYLVPACGRVSFDPHAAPPDIDPSVAHPDAARIPFQLGLIPDAPTIATIVITSDKVFEAIGPASSLPECAGGPPAASPST
jgi:hypothetical protein